MVRNINYKGSRVMIKRYRTGDLSKELQKRCACCRQKVNDCKVVLLVNNYQHIPNVLLHESCYAKWEGQEEKLCAEIDERYARWREETNVFGHGLRKRQRTGRRDEYVYRKSLYGRSADERECL